MAKLARRTINALQVYWGEYVILDAAASSCFYDMKATSYLPPAPACLINYANWLKGVRVKENQVDEMIKKRKL